MQPEIYVEFSLVFDNDFDVTEITRLTGIRSCEYSTRTKNRIDPITNKPIEGFWTIKSAVFMEFNVENALNDIVMKIAPQIPQMIDICNRYDGEAVFCIVSSFGADITPALVFDYPFLDVVHMLHATIQVDMYID